MEGNRFWSAVGWGLAFGIAGAWLYQNFLRSHLPTGERFTAFVQRAWGSAVPGPAASAAMPGVAAGGGLADTGGCGCGS